MNLSVKQFISEEQCYATIRDLRWSGKIPCPHCASGQIIKRGKRFDDLTGHCH